MPKESYLPEPVKKAYREVHSEPEFAEKNLEIAQLKPEFTALDTFGIPASILENETTFLKWARPRFLKFEDGSYIPKEKLPDFFSKAFQKALEALEDQRFLLSPKIGESFPLSRGVKQQIHQGFSDLTEVLGFFKKVSIPDDPAKQKDFFTPDRKSKGGAERLSACRILSIAYIMDRIKKGDDFKEFLEYSRFVLGQDKKQTPESGLLSTLKTSVPIEVIEEPDEGYELLGWLEKSQIIPNCHLYNIGPADSTHSYFIPEVHVGIKGGLRSFLKILRDPDAEFKPLDDFLRLRFIFEDNFSVDQILSLIADLSDEAEKKTNPRIEIDYKEHRYISKKLRQKYLLKESEESNDKKRICDVLEKIKEDENVSSGKGYKKLSIKVKLFKPGAKHNYFAFEIIFLRRTELKNNDKTEWMSDHFTFEIKQAVSALSRMNGKMKKDEIIEAIREYLERNMRTEKIPEKIIGKTRHPEVYGHSVIDVDFIGTLEEKAEKLFDFFIEDGTLLHVAADFPTIEKPDKKKREKSDYYIHEDVLKRILKSLNAEM